MRHWFLFTAALVAVLAAPAGAHPLGVSTNSLEDPTFGNVHLYAPAGTPKAAIPPESPALREVKEDDDGAAGEAVEALAAAGGPHGPGDLADLPLTVMMAHRPPTRMAVLLTGDGGLGPFDRRLADALVERGV